MTKQSTYVNDIGVFGHIITAFMALLYGRNCSLACVCLFLTFLTKCQSLSCFQDESGGFALALFHTQ